MKTSRNILIAFILNLGFAIFEIFGGIMTNSVAILSDAIHDFGDALSIGLSYFLEKKSKKPPTSTYTYGYLRYSVLGALITTTILFTGSILVIYNAIIRIINPVEINYSGMIIFAVIGVVVNLIAAKVTHHGHSLNQKSVNLHMIEDVYGWIIVLIGAIIMKFTDISIIDAILSLIVALYIIIHAIKNLKEIINIFLEKVPNNINITEIKKIILEINEVVDVHHIHVWSMDGYNNFATMHVVVDNNINNVKEEIRHKLSENGIGHVTIEIEDSEDHCDDKKCVIKNIEHHHHHH